MNNFTITQLEAEQNPEWREIIRQGLNQHSSEQIGNREFVEIGLVARDEDGRVVGGVLGGSTWGWMLVEVFWVDQELRGQGLGTALLDRAEQVARQCNCSYIILETFRFETLGFYRKRGYAIYGQLDDLPAGHTRYSLKKIL
jgi:GNAT superfamily N-acetyltransferase